MPRLTIALLATVACAAVQAEAAEPNEQDRKTLHAYHENCMETAKYRFLTHPEWLKCNEAYLKLKLSFVPGIDLDSYQRLPAPARAEANRSGYTGYRVWRMTRQGASTDT
ncbi:MAG: hypothetical protein AAGF74_17410 [Pseudomonadota bacterium]